MRRHTIIFGVVLLFFFIANAPIWAEESGESAAEAGDKIDWEGVTVLDLKTASRIALADNPSMSAVEERIIQAGERVAQARSTWLPRLDASASASLVRLSNNAHDANLQSARMFDPDASITDPQDYYTGGLTAIWTVFDGFKRDFAILSAQIGERRSREARLEARRLLLSAVAFGFHSAQLAREDIFIAEANETFNLRLLKEAEARRRAGAGSLSDELNFKVRVNEAKTELLRKQRDYETALIGLAGLLGVPNSVFPAHITLSDLQEEPPETLIAPESEPLITYAMDNRPDILDAKSAIEQSRADIGLAKAGYYPVINLSGTLEANKENSARLKGDDFGASVAVTFSYNLFSGWYDRARINEAKSGLREADKNLDDRRLTVASEVRKSIAGLASIQEQLLLQRSNTALVRQTRDLVEKEYAAGQASLVRLNEVQRDFNNALGRLALARAGLRQAWSDLNSVTAKNLTFAPDAP
ncbi:MAG: TolC family protein [Desulfobacterales bacterium]|nr:TolC family protein [Desulfobacterales bacterium]